MKENEYKCDNCAGVFEKSRSDEVAVAESEKTFGVKVTAESHALICNDCYQSIFGKKAPFTVPFSFYPSIRLTPTQGEDHD